MKQLIRCLGFQAGGIWAGIKKTEALDLGLIYTQQAAIAAAVFTRNKVQASPVRLSRNHIASGKASAVIVNSGNANCCTGPRGDEDARRMAELVASQLDLRPEQVMVASTGVIGEPLPVDKIEKAVPHLVKVSHTEGFSEFARAIMTTDTKPKLIRREGKIDGHSFSLVAVAKGAGMLRPDMATMLCFVCTDVEISHASLQFDLKNAVDQSLNCITVDGDTSTNDMVLAMASGQSGAKVVSDDHRKVFGDLLTDALLDLSRRLVQDGEGVTKVVEVQVKGAVSDEEAFRAADTVAHSPLVKTAFFGEDANWGRILMAVGRAGITLDPDLIDVYFDTVQMVKQGRGCGPQAEAMATAVLEQAEFSIVIKLNQGTGKARMITSDLSIDYVKINADYRS